MTIHVITWRDLFAIKPRLPAPSAITTPPDADLETRMLAIEAAMRTAYEESQSYARMVADANRRIQELESTHRIQERELADMRTMNSTLTHQIGELQGRLSASERSRELQGIRIGKLEAQAAEIPQLRHQVVTARMAARIYQLWGAEQVKRLQAADLPYDPEPLIPNVPLPDEVRI